FALQRMESDLSGRTDDGGAAGPAHAPLSHIRDEWRELSLSRVDETEEGKEVELKTRLPLLPKAAIFWNQGGPLSTIRWVTPRRSVTDGIVLRWAHLREVYGAVREYFGTIEGLGRGHPEDGVPRTRICGHGDSHVGRRRHVARSDLTRPCYTVVCAHINT